MQESVRQILETPVELKTWLTQTAVYWLASVLGTTIMVTKFHSYWKGHNSVTHLTLDRQIFSTLLGAW